MHDVSIFQYYMCDEITMCNKSNLISFKREKHQISTILKKIVLHY